MGTFARKHERIYVTEKPSPCPACGNPTTGKFCSSCGVGLRASCPSCGAEMSAGSKFCHMCGNVVLARSGSSSSQKQWIVGGAVAAVIGLAAVVWYNAPRPQVNTPAPTGLGAAATTDISQMSPREQANRLFDRVMAAQERGDQQEVDFFAPMAIQTHALLGALDNDARYHLGLLHTIGGSSEAALLQADSLELAVPGHLFAAILRATVALAAGDDAELASARQSFLEAYDREMASAKPEYTEHASSIDIFLAEARGNVTR